MLTLYIYSNETGKQIGAVTGHDNQECEQRAAQDFGLNDCHWSYHNVPKSNAL